MPNAAATPSAVMWSGITRAGSAVGDPLEHPRLGAGQQERLLAGWCAAVMAAPC